MTENPEAYGGAAGTDETAEQVGTLNVVAIDHGSTASTATLFAQEKIQLRAFDPYQATALRNELVKALKEQWPSRRHEYLAKVLEAIDEEDPDFRGYDDEPRDDLGRLIERLIGADPAPLTDSKKLKFLDVAWKTLAQFVDLHDDLEDWGRLHLHHLAGKAFDTPAFFHHSLHKVELAKRRTILPSILLVKGKDLDGARLTDAMPVPQAEVSYIRNAKRQLLRAGSDPVAERVIRQIYRDLRERVHDFADASPETFGKRADRVVVTYPTTTPPNVRERLREIVRDAGFRLPNLRFDEGVAAVMFTIMRELGGDTGLGAELFRARCRRVDATTWRRNVLVIDIGGGTTDVCLTALELRDLTPHLERRLNLTADDKPRRRGHAYHLSPRVLGSTGHAQYGGDLLTLRIFYWIKAVLVDALHAEGELPEHLVKSWPLRGQGQLAPRVADHGEVDPAPAVLAAYLRRAIPTATPRQEGEGPAGEGVYSVPLTAAFERLWALAEEAKEELAALEEHEHSWPLPLDKIQKLTEDLTDKDLGNALRHLGEDRLVLERRDFLRLARAIVGRSVALGVDLALRRLRTEPGEPLDGVALTGRATGMPLVRDLVLEQLTRAFSTGSGRTVGWNPATVAFEQDQPKEAASIGACWAQVLAERNVSAENLLKDGDGKIAKGQNVLIVDVDNLMLNVPADFRRGGDSVGNLRLIDHGTPLALSDERGGRSARSAWLPAPVDITVRRHLDERLSIEWGRYNLEECHGLTHAGSLFHQVALDEHLNPLLHLSTRERPAYVLEDTTVPLRDLLPATAFENGRLKSFPYDLQVRSTDPYTGLARWETVFPARADLSDDWFPDTCVTLDDSAPTGLRLAEKRLPDAKPIEPEHVGHPDPEALGIPGFVFRFLAADGSMHGRPFSVEAPVLPDEEDQPVTEPGGDRRIVPAVCWADLDMVGDLHISPGHPRYQEAGSFNEMLSEPGGVFITRMSPPQSDWQSDWDPFTGEH
ncbi:hypothetical protein ABGB12_32255 [Actinocorallia sp. B10E7]|uniref:hypothetical protein n=1 Tax=Actinocorallia sp. B10E7 TaxID=3153558 RepID=UPI00325D55C5